MNKHFNEFNSCNRFLDAVLQGVRNSNLPQKITQKKRQREVKGKKGTKNKKREDQCKKMKEKGKK